MKKILFIILLIALLCSPVFAKTETFEELGMKIDYQEVFDKSLGVTFVANHEIIAHEPYISIMLVGYIALPKSELEKIKYATQVAQMQSLKTKLAIVLVTNGNLENALTKLDNENLKISDFIKFGSVEDYSFYFASLLSDDFLGKLDFKYKSDVEQVNTRFLEILKNAELFTPVDPEAELIGKVIKFEANTLDGEKLSSSELFANNKITMINVWGTWCVFCVKEMSALAELHKRLQAKGCGIIGIEVEYSLDKDNVKKFLEEKGVTFPNVIMPQNPGDVLGSVKAFPTSFFVDKDGNLLTYPIMGALIDEYEPTIDKLLAKTANKENAFNIYLLNGNEPVKGVLIQFCDDSICNVGETNSKGLVSFNVPAGKIYEVHVLKTPSGYKANSEIYKTQNIYGNIVINIEKE